MKIAILVTAMLVATQAHSQVYKCNGGYTDKPCGEELKIRKGENVFQQDKYVRDASSRFPQQAREEANTQGRAGGTVNSIQSPDKFKDYKQYGPGPGPEYADPRFKGYKQY